MRWLSIAINSKLTFLYLGTKLIERFLLFNLLSDMVANILLANLSQQRVVLYDELLPQKRPLSAVQAPPQTFYRPAPLLGWTCNCWERPSDISCFRYIFSLFAFKLIERIVNCILNACLVAFQFISRKTLLQQTLLSENQKSLIFQQSCPIFERWLSILSWGFIDKLIEPSRLL